MRKLCSVSSLILGIVLFAGFTAAACLAYYTTAGVFVTAQLAALYAALGLLGALAVVFRWYTFAFLFYAGCALGWAAGNYIGSLNGDFAPTAGVITASFLMCAFALVGLILEVGRQKNRMRRKAARREAERQAEQARRQAEGQADAALFEAQPGEGAAPAAEQAAPEEPSETPAAPPAEEAAPADASVPK